MADKVTKRQQAVLDCIEECIREKGYGPTVREVCQSLGLSSPSTVHVHLKALEEKGLIERHRASGDYRAVSVSLTEEGERFAAEGRRLRDEHMDAVMEHVGIEDMRHLVRILRKVVEFHELDPEATCKSRAEGHEAPCA